MKVIRMCTCEKHGVVALVSPHLSYSSLSLCHTLPLSGSYLSPSDPRHIYPFPSTASDPLGNKQNNQSDLSESLLTVERSFLSGMTGISFSLFSLYKSNCCREKCIDFEGWLHHRCCVQSCLRKKAHQYYSYSSMVECYRPEP